MARLTAADRRSLPSSAYVFPDRAPKSGSYPIPDRAHAVIAIKDATGTKDEGAVRAAVKRKFGIG